MCDPVPSLSRIESLTPPQWRGNAVTVSQEESQGRKDNYDDHG